MTWHFIFSRAPIPYQTNELLHHVYKHIGIYAYRAAFLLEIVRIPPCDMEQLESLEQLRVLWAGYRIKVEQATVEPSQDINTREDYEKLQQLCEVS